MNKLDMYIKYMICLACVSVTHQAGYASNDGCLLSYPLQPTDTSGKNIDTYCVVPLYTKSSGLRLGVEQRGGNRDSKKYLIWVSNKSTKEEFACLKKTDGVGVSLPFPPYAVGFGERVRPTRFLFLKRRFKPFVWDGYIGKTEAFAMAVGSSDELVQQILSGKIDQYYMKSIYGLHAKEEVVDELSSGEREKLRRCYYEQ